MSESEQASPRLPHHNNNQLFSDYYLNEIVHQQAAWKELLPDAQLAMQAISLVFQSYTPSTNEAQTERDLIRPILARLGHDFEVQPALETPAGPKRPDYIFYRNSAALNVNKNKTLNDTLPKHGGLAVGDAKYWDRPLDVALRSRGGDPFTNKNASYQIAYYIQHTGLTWGVLTNGRLWRLYHKDTAHKLDRFYEVDLPALIANNDPGAFLYFYAFFSRTAFDEGGLGVAAMLRESTEFARSIGESLKTQVFLALTHLAQGFLDYPANRIMPDPAALTAIYDNSLIVLYRLLFILYAEDRGLLPVREPGPYRDTYSLYAIKRAVSADMDAGRYLLPTSTRYWPQLRDLFGFINSGSPPLHVSTFDGGLFDAGRFPLLERYIIGDLHLQHAIDCLSRVKTQYVDYRDLSVRHLGTIYEGLLEYRLTIDPPVTIGAEDHRSDAIHSEGSQYRVGLLNEKGERKASGSYFTPDDIVKFMVENAVGPLLRSAVEGKVGDDAKIEAVLDLNVLDPAMGSGHFLVEATESIARFLADIAVIQEGDPELETDLAYWKRRVAQNCIYGVDLNPLAVELAKLSLWLTTAATNRPLSFLDHHLRCGNSIVGARLDDLQVGHQAGRKSKRLSREAKQEAAGQISMLADDSFLQSMRNAVGNMWLIESSEGRTVSQVKQQEALYSDLRIAFTSRYGKLADLVTALSFGVTIDSLLWQPLADFATGRGLTTLPDLAARLEESARVAEAFRFFHWELEFPEAFFDRHGRPLGAKSGFDVVIGNPPYIRQEELSQFKPYLGARYSSFHGAADLYIYFYEQGLRLTKEGGRMAFISSGTFARSNSGAAFRKLLPSLAHIETVIDYGENQPFEGAEMVRPTILILQRGNHAGPFRSLFIANKIPESLEDALAGDGIECDDAVVEQSEWVFLIPSKTSLTSKIQQVGRKLIDFVDGKIHYGVKTGLNEAFVVDRATQDRLILADKSSRDILKPLCQGQDLRPWYQENEDRWLVFARRGIDIEAYPAIRDYLQLYRSQLEPLPDKWVGTQPWSGRKAGAYRWYEIQDSVDYYAAFDVSKIVWPDISKLPRFSWAEAGVYLGNTGYIIPTTDPSLLAVLQSRVTWYAASQICQPLRLRAGLWQYRMLPQFVSRLPIPEMSEDERALLAGIAVGITAEARSRYALHRKVRHRLAADFGIGDAKLNNKLTNWWELDFGGLRAEVKKVFHREVPLRDRDELESWLNEQKGEHLKHTAEIVRLETDLNAVVYTLFGLSTDEVAEIEMQTKYSYGEV